MDTHIQKNEIMVILGKHLENAVSELQQKKYYGSIDVNFFNQENEKVLSGYHFINKVESQN